MRLHLSPKLLACMAVATIIGSANAASTITDGLVTYWDYDSGEKTAPVDGNGNTVKAWSGYYESGYTYTNDGGVGNSGYAQLSSAGGYYIDNCGLSTDTGFSVSFAVKSWDGNNLVNFKQNDTHIILKVRGNVFTLETTGDAMGITGSFLLSNPTTLDSGVWNRLTLTCTTNGLITLYSNGTAYELDKTWSGALGGAQIASAYGVGSWNTTAHLDDIGIWNRALTAEEAMALSVNTSIINTVLVPEPSTASLGLLGLSALLMRRRRR